MAGRQFFLTASVALVVALVGVASPHAVEAASPNPTPMPSFRLTERLELTIDAVVGVGEADARITCPAQVTLFFDRYGGDPTTIFGRAGLWASCTDSDRFMIDASGTFDGHSFALSEGRYTYTGSLNGNTATITGEGNSFEFAVPPPPMSEPTPTPTASPTSTPATEPLGVTKDVSGDVYISPADEADLEPAARTWRPVKPGDRLALEEGAMLRTGRDGTVAILFDRGALTRLGPSTLFGLKKNRTAQGSLSTMLGRLYDGIAYFYMKDWKESGKQFEVETDRANTSIQGTTYEIAVTDASTVVTVTEGVVEVTDKATGAVIDVGPGERATVDASGMTKIAAPDALASAAPSGPGPEASVSGLPVDITLALGSAVALVVVGLVALVLVRRRRPPLVGPPGGA